MSDRAVYVYGVAPAERADSLVTRKPGLEGRPLELLAAAGLVALVSGIDQAELERRVSAAREGDLAALVPLLRRHEAVLSRALEGGPILPFRFGIVVTGDEGVRRLLQERGAELGAQLERVDDACEWGVKALVARESLEAFVVEETPRLFELAQEAGDGGGAAFFARKRLERELDTRLREAAADLAAEAHERLAACALLAAANPPQPRELSGYAEEMILNGAYLVARRSETALRDAVLELGAELGGRGLRLELTGPWPPFNFVDAAAPVNAR